MSAKNDRVYRNIPGIPRAMLTTGLVKTSTAIDSGDASSIGSSYATYTIDLSGTDFADYKGVGLKVRTTDAIVAQLGGAGDVTIAAADTFSEMIYMALDDLIADLVQLKSASGTALEYIIYIF